MPNNYPPEFRRQMVELVRALAFLAVTRAAHLHPGDPPDDPASGGETLTAASPERGLTGSNPQ